MTPKELFDYAINANKLHDRHLTLARESALRSDGGAVQWALHVDRVLISRYRRKHRQPYDGMPNADIEETAILLRDHYAKLIK